MLNKVIIFVLFPYKKYSCRFITSQLNHWCGWYKTPPWACGHVMCEAQHGPGLSLCESDMLGSRWMCAIRMLQEQGRAPEKSWSKRLLFPRRRLVDSRWHKHRLMNIWSHPGLHLTQLAQTQRTAAQQYLLASGAHHILFFFVKGGHGEGKQGEYENVLFVYWCRLYHIQVLQREKALFSCHSVVC